MDNAITVAAMMDNAITVAAKQLPENIARTVNDT